MKLSSLRAIKNIHYSEVFGILEKSAIVKIMLMMCTTDTDFHVDERAFIKELLTILQIDKKQFESITKLSEERTFQILISMEDSRKTFFYQLMRNAIMADGEAKQQEIQLFREICERVGIDVKPSTSDN